MGLFKKKQKTDTNQIANTELKEKLADSALAVLINAQKITHENLAGIKAEFGYLLMIEDHGLEALFKIIQNDDVYYFAVQQDKLMMVNIIESQYEATVAHMLSQHT